MVTAVSGFIEQVGTGSMIKGIPKHNYHPSIPHNPSSFSMPQLLWKWPSCHHLSMSQLGVLQVDWGKVTRTLVTYYSREALLQWLCCFEVLSPKNQIKIRLTWSPHWMHWYRYRCKNLVATYSPHSAWATVHVQLYLQLIWNRVFHEWYCEKSLMSGNMLLVRAQWQKYHTKYIFFETHLKGSEPEWSNPQMLG